MTISTKGGATRDSSEKGISRKNASRKPIKDPALVGVPQSARMPNLPRLSPVLPSSMVAGFPERKDWGRQSNLVFVITLSIYMVMACWLAFDVQFYLGDALSRTQAAESVLYSRNPNLAVMGFIFTPLTTIAQLPLAALAPLLPELTNTGLSGAVVSAVFMAGACRQLWLIAAERDAPRWYAVIAVGMFAVHPMILIYGAVGMSEAPFIFGVLWASRRLIRWTSTDDVHDLIVAGFAFAVAFLARYDALVMTFVVMLLVGATVWRARHRRNWTDRFGFAFLDMLVLVWPIGLAFLTWTVASWMSTGELLAQFTSQYGNSAIIEQMGGGPTGLPALLDALYRILLIAPALPVLLIVVVFFSLRRKDVEPYFPIVIMLTVLAFQTLTYTLGSTFGFLRFFIIAIALTSVLLIQVIPPGGRFPTLRPGATYIDRRTARAPRTGTKVFFLLLVLIGTVITTVGMGSPKWAPQEFALKQAIPVVDKGTVAEQEYRLRMLKTFSTERYIANHLDSLNLGEAQVLTSVTRSFAVLTSSQNQKQFVIPSDEDFITALNNPSEAGLRYLLVSSPEVEESVDPINMRYPELYETGSGIATLELEFQNQGVGQPDWRLYRVLSVPEEQ